MNLFKKENNMNDKYISFKGKKYSFNFDKLKEFCLTSSDNGAKEYEITQVYEPILDGELGISSRVEHEIKSSKTPQNDVIMCEIIKLFVYTLLDRNITEDEYKMDFSSAIAINTLLSWGILEEK
jgi:hypothetical protein